MAADAEVCRNENVYKHVALQEAEERRLRDKELTRMRLEWLEQMKVSGRYCKHLGCFTKRRTCMVSIEVHVVHRRGVDWSSISFW